MRKIGKDKNSYFIVIVSTMTKKIEVSGQQLKKLESKYPERQMDINTSSSAMRVVLADET